MQLGWPKQAEGKRNFSGNVGNATPPPRSRVVAIVPNFAAEARQKPRVSSVSLSIHPFIDRQIYIYLDSIV